jgi:hypothetical protein
MKKYILLGVTIVALSAGAFVSEKTFLASPHTVGTTLVATTSNTASVAPTSPPPKTTTETKKTSPNITLSVGSTAYQVYAPEHASVLDVMRTLATTNAFSFSGKEFPSLGFFVDSINGKKNGDGLYWILYVNGTSSDTGASETFLKAGDAVEWKYEKDY